MVEIPIFNNRVQINLMTEMQGVTIKIHQTIEVSMINNKSMKTLWLASPLILEFQSILIKTCGIKETIKANKILEAKIKEERLFSQETLGTIMELCKILFKEIGEILNTKHN